MDAQVENAVEISFSPSSDHELKRQAMEFLQQAKESVDGWQVCLPLFVRVPKASEIVRLFSLDVLNTAIQRRFHQIDNQSLAYIQQTLVDYMRTTYIPGAAGSDSPSIQNKLTQTMTYLFVNLYPAAWPSFFDDILVLTTFGGEGPWNNLQGVAFFLRMMVSVHDEVADVLMPRSPEEQQRNAAIKDCIRERDVPKLVAAWQEILEKWKGKNDEVVDMCFRVIGRWVSWIDISLVVNGVMLGLIFQFLASGGRVRDASIEALTEIIGKKMKAPDKLELILFLNLGEIVGQIIASPALQSQGTADYDTELAEGAAKLVNTAGLDIVLIMNRVSEEIDAQNGQRAEELLQSFIPYLLRFFSDEYDDVSTAVFPFMTELLSFLRKEKKTTNTLPQSHAAVLPSILSAIVMKTKYDEDTTWGDDGEQTDEAEFQELRKKLKTMQDAVSVIDEKLFIDFLSQVVENTFDRVAAQGGNGAIDWRETEVALSQMHAFGELALRTGGMFAKGQPNGPAAERLIGMMIKMMSANVANSIHPAIKLKSMEIFVRYSPFFEVHTNFITLALENFINGIHDNHLRVKTRSWYLFHRFVRTLRPHIGEIAQTVLEAINDLLVIVAELPRDKDDEDDMSSDAEHNEDTTFESQLNLFEAVGCISSAPSVPVEKQALFVKSVMGPLFMDIEKHLGQAEKGDNRAVLQIHHDIMALGTLAKGYSDSWAGEGRNTKASVSPIQEEFTQTTEAILVALQRLNQFPLVREAARYAFSRMVGVLGPKILPLLPRWIEGLMTKSATKEEMATFLKLLEQLIHGFKSEVFDILNSLLTPLLTHLFTSLSEPVSGTDDEVQLKDLRREYLNFLLTIINNDLGQVLVSQANQGIFENLLGTIEHFAKEISDPGTEKIAFNLLNKMSMVFGPATGSMIKQNGIAQPQEQPLFGFEGLMTERFSLLCWEVPANSAFNSKDAQSKMVLSEMALLQKTLYVKLGDGFLEYLRNVSFPNIGVNQGVNEYCEALRTMEGKDFKGFFLKFVQAIGA